MCIRDSGIGDKPTDEDEFGCPALASSRSRGLATLGGFLKGVPEAISDAIAIKHKI